MLHLSRTRTISAGLLTLVLLTSACSSSSPDPTTGPTAQTPTVSATPDIEPVAYQDAPSAMGVLRDRHAAYGLGLDESQTRGDAFGQWHPTKVQPDSVLLQMPTSLLPEQFTQEQLQPAYELAVNYIISEFMDGELLWDDSDEARLAFVERQIRNGAFMPGTDQHQWWMSAIYRVAGNSDESVASSFSADFNPMWSLLADQNYQNWKTEGYPRLGSPAVEPAPYSLTDSRVLLNYFYVTEIATDPTYDDTVTFRFYWEYATPAVTAECPSGCALYRTASLSLSMIFTDPQIGSWDTALSIPSFGKIADFKQLASGSPFLPEGEVFADSRDVAIGNLNFALRSSWADAAASGPETSPGTFEFVLPDVDDGLSGNVLVINTTNSADVPELHYEASLYMHSSSMWRVTSPDRSVTGTAVNYVYPGFDYITLELTDADGVHYSLEGRVPSTTGLETMASLVAGLRTLP